MRPLTVIAAMALGGLVTLLIAGTASARPTMWYEVVVEDNGIGASNDWSTERTTRGSNPAERRYFATVDPAACSDTPISLSSTTTSYHIIGRAPAVPAMSNASPKITVASA